MMKNTRVLIMFTKKIRWIQIAHFNNHVKNVATLTTISFFFEENVYFNNSVIHTRTLND